MDEVKQALQNVYNNLIKRSNVAYIESNKPKIMSAGLAMYWQGKAEAFEDAAAEFRDTLITYSVWLKPQTTMRVQDIETERQAKIQTDPSPENDFS